MNRGVNLDDIGPVPAATEVAARAHDTDDARLLLAALGLDHQEAA